MFYQVLQLENIQIFTFSQPATSVVLVCKKVKSWKERGEIRDT